MRLPKVKHGHRFKERMLLRLIALMNRARVADVIRTFLYRPDYFGQKLGSMAQQVMRGPSVWSVGERELFAAFVSRVNRCPF